MGKNYFRNQYRTTSIRAEWWDYRNSAIYFITVCTKDKEIFFGKISESTMILSEIGKIVNNCWLSIPERYRFVQLDEFIVMPNHLHGIIVINADQLYPTESRSLCEDYHQKVSSNILMSALSPKVGSLSYVVRTFKAAVTKQATGHCDYFRWQPRFYERIIRDAKELERVRIYIRNNPRNWKEDKMFK